MAHSASFGGVGLFVFQTMMCLTMRSGGAAKPALSLPKGGVRRARKRARTIAFIAPSRGAASFAGFAPIFLRRDGRVPLDKFEGVVKRHSTSAVRQHRLLASFVEDESHWRSRSYHLPVKPLLLLSSFHQPSIRPRRVPMIFLCEPPDTTGGESAQSIQRSNRPQSIDPGAPAGCSR